MTINLSTCRFFFLSRQSPQSDSPSFHLTILVILADSFHFTQSPLSSLSPNNPCHILLPFTLSPPSLLYILLPSTQPSLPSLQILLPVQRRAPGDPVRDEGPPARAASPQEVLRGHQFPALLAAAGDRGHDLGRRGARPVQQPGHSCQSSGEKEESYLSIFSCPSLSYFFFCDCVFCHFCYHSFPQRN